MDTAEMEKRLTVLKAELATVQGTPTEVYSRIVGYYRSVKNWNAGKRDEFSGRTTFRMPDGVPSALDSSASRDAPSRAGIPMVAPSLGDVLNPAAYLLFTRKTCPNCPPVREYIDRTGLRGKEVDVDTPEGLDLARTFRILASPTVILLDLEDREVYRAFTVTELRAFLETEPALA